MLPAAGPAGRPRGQYGASVRSGLSVSVAHYLDGQSHVTQQATQGMGPTSEKQHPVQDIYITGKVLHELYITGKGTSGSRHTMYVQ